MLTDLKVAVKSIDVPVYSFRITNAPFMPPFDLVLRNQNNVKLIPIYIIQTNHFNIHCALYDFTPPVKADKSIVLKKPCFDHDMLMCVATVH